MTTRVFILLVIVASGLGMTIQSLIPEPAVEKDKPYVLNPAPTDSLCIGEINRARMDSSNGRIVFTIPMGFGTTYPRYVKELRELCNVYGISFSYDMIGCVRSEGQTQGCYGDYMDWILANKFGPDFKTNLKVKADSLFVLHAQTDTTEYWDCDERAHLPTEKKRTDDAMPAIPVKDLDIKSKTTKYGTDYPFIDFGFVVNTDSTASNFYLRSWVAADSSNEQYKKQLFDLAVREMQTKYPKWIPGMLSGIPIPTYNNVRFHFIPL